MGILRVYCLKTLKKPSIYPLGKTPSAPSVSTIVFDESCRLRDLTEAQVGRNQFAMDVAVDRLDGEADHAAEWIGALEDKMADVEWGLDSLLELGREQTETSTQTA